LNNKARNTDSWILLNSQSTVSVLTNKKLVRNIREVKKPLTLDCNTVVTTVEKITDLIRYRMAWYYEGVIANLLSLKKSRRSIV